MFIVENLNPCEAK